MEVRPLLTVGIPAFEAQATIERAVASALAQTWRPLEVVVVDDGATDATASIAAGLAARHPEVRLIRHARNRGTAAARNTIIEAARGVAIAFFDHDDVSEPARLAAQWGRLTAHERRFSGGAPVLCHASYRMVFPDGRTRIVPTLGADVDRPGPHGRELLDHLLLGRAVPGGGRSAATLTQFARVATYRHLGGFDEAFRRQEDTELNVRLARAGGYLIGVDRILVTQVVTAAPHKSWDLERETQTRLLSKHRDAFRSPATYAHARRWSAARFDWYGRAPMSMVRHLGVAALLAPCATAVRLWRATVSVGDKQRG